MRKSSSHFSTLGPALHTMVAGQPQLRRAPRSSDHGSEWLRRAGLNSPRPVSWSWHERWQGLTIRDLPGSCKTGRTRSTPPPSRSPDTFRLGDPNHRMRRRALFASVPGTAFVSTATTASAAVTLSRASEIDYQGTGSLMSVKGKDRLRRHRHRYARRGETPRTVCDSRTSYGVLGAVLRASIPSATAKIRSP